MSKVAALKIVNVLLAILIATQMASGYFGRDIGRTAFDVVHRGGAVVLIVLVVAHLWLNWNWVKTVFGKRHS
jgi:hypothetical protein